MYAAIEIPEPITELKPASKPPVRRKVLLVDDDPAIRQILRRLLTEEGFDVLTAADGAEALVVAQAAKLDLVLLDLNMPVKSGWETFEELSRNNPLLPIILITARPNQFFPALASGAGALLEKPLDFTKLFYTIQNLLVEPAEVRLSRSAGHPALFRYSPAEDDGLGKNSPAPQN